MGEPSKEALAEARGLTDITANGNRRKHAIAAAIQRHMDATDKVEALAEKQNQVLKEILEKWEQAKRKYEAGAAVVLGFKERAEKAEATVDDLSRELTDEIEAHRETRAGLDAFVKGTLGHG